jgi:hypothetical protein
VKVASLLDMPPAVRYFFDDGSMLYNDEKIYQGLSVSRQPHSATTRTITPNERLNPVDKKELLSSILKFLRPGNWRMIRSTHITDAVYGISMNPIYLESAAQPKKTSPPTVQAVVRQYSLLSARRHRRSRSHTYAAHDGHDPAAGVIVEHAARIRRQARWHAGTFLRDVERRSRTRPRMFVRGESRRVHLLMYADFRSSKCC